MKNKIFKFSIFAIFISSICLAVFSYKNDYSSKNYFLNVQKANDEIAKKTGFNILDFRKKVDDSFPEVNFYKLDLEEFLGSGGKSRMVDEFGFIIRKDDNSTITPKETNYLLNSAFEILAKNIYFHKDDHSDTHDEKGKLYNFFMEIRPAGKAFYSVSTPYGRIGELYRNKRINYNEFSFLYLFVHWTTSLENISKRKHIKNIEI